MRRAPRGFDERFGLLKLLVEQAQNAIRRIAVLGLAALVENYDLCSFVAILAADQADEIGVVAHSLSSLPQNLSLAKNPFCSSPATSVSGST